jgi:hypothetical protein
MPQLPHVATSPSLPDVNLYVCPLCLEGYGVEQLELLTREHAPPQAVGGSVITLTCGDCNTVRATFKVTRPGG